MAETFYLVPDSGVACGPGDHETLVNVEGNSSAEKVLDGTGDTWNVGLPKGGVLAGTWSVAADIEVATGGGGGDKVTCTVAIYDSACGFARHTIFADEVDMLDGFTALYGFGSVDPGEIRYENGDILRVVFSQTAGADACTLHYNGSIDEAALTLPDRFVQLATQDGVDTAHRAAVASDFVDPESSGTDQARVTYKADDFVSVTQSGTDTAHRTAAADDFIVRE